MAHITQHYGVHWNMSHALNGFSFLIHFLSITHLHGENYFCKGQKCVC